MLYQTVKYEPTKQETWVWSLSQEDPFEKRMTTHSSILAWRIPWTEEPGGLQSTVSQRVGYDWATKTFRFRVSLKRLGLGLSRRSSVPLVGHSSWDSVRTRLERPIWKISGQGWDQWGPFSSSLSPSCAFRGTESALAFDLEKEGKIIRENNLKTT